MATLDLSKSPKDHRIEVAAISALCSTAPFGDDQIQAMAVFIEALKPIPTKWVVKACGKLSAEWRENRAPQPGDVRAHANAMRRLAEAREENEERRRLLGAGEPAAPGNFTKLADLMRDAIRRANAMTPEEKAEAHERYLREDVQSGRLTDTAARSLRAARGGVAP